MAEILERLPKNIKETEDWSASMYKYLKEALSSLERIKEAEDINIRKSLYKKASHALRNAQRSESRGIRRYYLNRVKDDLKELKDILPGKEKGELEKIEGELEPHEAKLIREASFFIGELKDNFERLGPQLDLLKKGKASEESVKRLLDDVTQKVESTIAARAERGEVGLVPFIAGIERLKGFVQKLEKMAA